MTMFGEYELREIALSITLERKKVETLLQKNGLRLAPLDTFVGIFDNNDELVGGGGIKENIIKCVAILSDHRKESLANALISRLREIVLRKGYDNILVFTKPKNESVFHSLAFYTIARSPNAIFLESNPRCISSFTKRLGKLYKEGQNGAIVIHGNPFTLGHQALIKYASRKVDNLYVFLVNDNSSAFSYNERYEMLTTATKMFPNVTVINGEQYILSAATFPSYFLKDASEAADAQMDIDLDIFEKYIIPTLHLIVRFVGSEQTDKLTYRYNERMKSFLSIEIREMQRISICNTIVSASLVRNYIKNCEASKGFSFVPLSTIPFILSHAAVYALYSELKLTPKPGLVDSNDTGAHKDMYFQMMEKSIQTLKPYFTELAKLGLNEQVPSIEKIQTIGIDAEKAMFAASKGVNTYRGALFSLGITLVAAANCFYKYGIINCKNLQENITLLAKDFPNVKGSHGDEVQKKYNVSGALSIAKEGYTPLFNEWFPFYQTTKKDDESKLRLLLFIMSMINDTNIYYRCGKEVAQEVKDVASSLLKNFSLQNLIDTNKKFIKQNISPGGAADMLALTLFVDSIILR